MTEREQAATNGRGDRIDELGEAVADLTRLVHTCIARVEYAAKVSESARDAASASERSSAAARASADRAAREAAATQVSIGALTTEMATVRNTIGRWPSGPDDKGSGIAGQVAKNAQALADEGRISRPTFIVQTGKAGESEGPPSLPVPVPKGLRALAKRYRKWIGLAILVAATAGAAVKAYVDARGAATPAPSITPER